MAPIQPWLLRPKKSLGFFKGMGEVLDKRQERKDTLEARLRAEEDRSRAHEMQDLQKRSLEQAIAAAGEPKPEEWDRFEADGGFFEQNRRTREIRPLEYGGTQIRGRTVGQNVPSTTDAQRLNQRISELVAAGKSLAEANQIARTEFGYPPRVTRSAPSPDADRRERAAEVRAAESKVGGLRREFQGVLSRRPRQSQFTDQLTRMADTTAFNEAMPHWRADSTEVHNSLRAAQDELAGLKGPPAPSPRASSGGRGGGGNPKASVGLKPISATDRQKAKTDPAFAAWLRANGYDVDGKGR